MLDLCPDHGNELQVVLVSRRADDVATFLAHPLATLGSDGSALPLDIGADAPHPRSYGAHARLLGHYAVHLGLLAVEAAVAKMTSRRRAASASPTAVSWRPAWRPTWCVRQGHGPRSGDVRTTGPAADRRASRDRERRSRRRRRRAHRRPRRAGSQRNESLRSRHSSTRRSPILSSTAYEARDVGADTLIAANGRDASSRMAQATQREPISFSSSSSE